MINSLSCKAALLPEFRFSLTSHTWTAASSISTISLLNWYAKSLMVFGARYFSRARPMLPSLWTCCCCCPDRPFDSSRLAQDCGSIGWWWTQGGKLRNRTKNKNKPPERSMRTAQVWAQVGKVKEGPPFGGHLCVLTIAAHSPMPLSCFRTSFIKHSLQGNWGKPSQCHLKKSLVHSVFLWNQHQDSTRTSRVVARNI